MNLKNIFAVAAPIGALLMSQSALAGTIDVNYMGAANFGHGSVGYIAGSVVPNPNSATLVSVNIGGDSFTSLNHSYDFSTTGQFNTWCVDLYHWLNGSNVTYRVGTGADLAADLNKLHLIQDGTQRVTQLITLADEVYSSVDTQVESTAFQLAVWAITFGTPDSTGHYHVNASSAGFKVDSGTATSAYGVMANSWLDHLGTVGITGNYTLAYLNDGERNNTQDMIVFTDPPTIPEPTLLSLFGLGLVGLGLSRRGKTRTRSR